MRTRFVKGIVASVMMLTLILGCFTGTAQAKEWNVKPSNVNYYVNLDNTECIFLCNQYGAGTAVGTEYYLTYTVEKVDVKTVGANGVLGCDQPGARWPYVTSPDGTGGGLMNHNIMNQLMIEGNTYFLKFSSPRLAP